MRQVQSYLSALVSWLYFLWQKWFLRFAQRGSVLMAMMLIIVIGMKLIAIERTGVDPWP